MNLETLEYPPLTEDLEEAKTHLDKSKDELDTSNNIRPVHCSLGKNRDLGIYTLV